MAEAARDAARSERDEAIRGWNETRAAMSGLDAKLLSLDREKAEAPHTFIGHDTSLFFRLVLGCINTDFHIQKRPMPRNGLVW